MDIKSLIVGVDHTSDVSEFTIDEWICSQLSEVVLYMNSVHPEFRYNSKYHEHESVHFVFVKR